MLCTLLFAYVLFHHGSPMRLDSASGFDPGDTLTQAADVVAFSAELSAHTDIPGDSVIIFDKVLANIGGRYVNTSGQFACADDGVYVFIWSLLKSTVTEEGMRCMTRLRSGATDWKFGPKTSYNSTANSGVAEMTSLFQCTTSPLTAVTVVTVPWSQDAGSLANFRAEYTAFSGFRLMHEIAFTAELSQDQNVFPGSKIMFDHVLLNHGNHYDDINHSFRCPDDGVYVFSVSTYTRDPATPWSVSELVKDRQVVLQGPITYRATVAYDSGSASATAVLQCTQGASVYVEAQPAHDFPYNSYGAELTSFTGFKLYDDVEGAVAFTAVMSMNHTNQYANHPFTFDQIITNVGNAFDTVHSEFVCPDNDYYLFTWSTVASYGVINTTHTNLYMNDTRIKSMPLTPQSDSDETGTTGSSSISIIQQCETGSRLYVVGRTVAEITYLGGYTSFSGYKIPY